MKITWLGTASIRIESGKDRLLFDPFVELAGGSNPNALEDFLEDTDICITHGHVDHLYFVPALVEEADATVHCTRAAAATLEKYLEDAGNVVCVAPGDCWMLGDMRIRAYQGRHIPLPLLCGLRRLFSLRFLRRPLNLFFLAWAHPRFPEKGETLAYEIEAEGKRILLLGSMALDTDTVYPENVDLLILPFQGTGDVEKAACDIVKRIRPGSILLSHFDDAFPPVSEEMDTRRFHAWMRRNCPDIRVVKPAAGKPVHF